MESCKCQNQKLQTNFKDFMCKLCKLKHVHECLNHILQFLKDYLPLANSHTNEFITNNTWETFLPENIRDELSSMCDEHLIGLPSYHRTIQTNITNRSQAEKEREKVEGNSVDDFTIKENMCTIVSGCSVMGIERENVAKKFNSHGKKFSGGYSKKNMNIDCQKDDKDYKVVTNSLINSCVTCENNFITVPGQGHDSPIFSCPYFDQAPKVNGKHKLIKGFPPNWVHRDLTSFLREAESNTLEHFNLALSLKEFYSKLSVPIDDDKIFIPHIMNMKKSHEVDVMGEVCSHLAKKYGTNLIVDMGSGKGYLSTQLALQYGLVVIGIDAMSINTDGAQKRAGKLVKHWNGLVRNATEDKIRGYKVKRSKKLKKKLKREALKKKENKTEIKESSQISDVYCTVSEELPDFQNLFHDFTDGCQTLESHSAEDNEPTGVNSMSKLNDNHSDVKALKEEIKCCNELGTYIQTNIGLEVNQRNIKLEPGTATESNIQSYQNLHFKQNKDETNTIIRFDYF
ncbi:hypothetical protein KUTeg_007766 [Tegillarca granosa]|uniref:Methyltransferase domain-containing protein n=1 Tax=Tegillarca granosa TaxID=220873 RepID=A0ABQ9FG51_TEGGR|nr:hypothetical protein KUTeg_007766 [Tegillarca granosa]